MTANQMADVFLGRTGGALTAGEGAKPTICRELFSSRRMTVALRNWISAVPPTLACCWPARTLRDFTTTQTRSSTNSFKAGTQSAVWPDAFHFPPDLPAKFTLSRRDLALYAAISVAAMPSGTFGRWAMLRGRTLGLGCGLQPGSDWHIHALGSLRWIHVFASATGYSRR